MNIIRVSSIIVTLILLTSCGSQDWRHGNPYGDTKIMKKRQDERDHYQERAAKIRKKTAKHYIKEYKSHDGDINVFRRDGFDWGW
jgi:major membrane immunogen (membrane-anchored lipoprotein)